MNWDLVIHPILCITIMCINPVRKPSKVHSQNEASNLTQKQFKNAMRIQTIFANALARNIGSKQSKNWEKLYEKQRKRSAEQRKRQANLKKGLIVTEV